MRLQAFNSIRQAQIDLLFCWLVGNGIDVAARTIRSSRTAPAALAGGAMASCWRRLSLRSYGSTDLSRPASQHSQARALWAPEARVSSLKANLEDFERNVPGSSGQQWMTRMVIEKVLRPILLGRTNALLASIRCSPNARVGSRGRRERLRPYS